MINNITNLDDASLGTILDFLPGHFRFLVSVNRRFRFLYHHTPSTFFIAAMTSSATREIWLEEDEANVRRNGCKFSTKYGNLEAFRWLQYRDCHWTSRVCREAAGRRHLHVLRWARTQTPPCPWDEQVCIAAAKYGQLEVLQWLRSQTPPSPWNGDVVCTVAASHGQLEVLQWLRSQTPPYSWNWPT